MIYHCKTDNDQLLAKSESITDEASLQTTLLRVIHFLAVHI